MKIKKTFKKLALILTMIMCTFTVVSLSSTNASAAYNRGPLAALGHNAYLRTYSNGCTEVYLDLEYPSRKVTCSTNIAWLVKSGSNSNSIKMLQAALNTTMAGSDNYLNVDGIWGPKTRSALINYQTWHMGASQADGICGPKTWRYLVESINIFDKY